MLNRTFSLWQPILVFILQIAVFPFLSTAPAHAADLNPGMNQPDHAAWQLFASAVQYRATAGNNDAMFETWAGDADTFSAMPAWPAGGGTHRPLAGSLLGRSLRAHGPAPAAVPLPAECIAGWRPGAPACIGEETRRNRAAFDYIVQNGLYNQASLAAFFGKTLSFPVGAVELKADWIPVDELKSWNGTPPEQADMLYHVNTVPGSGGKPIAYALVALHLVSKAVPSWSWASFEHWKNPGRCDDIGCHDLFGAATANVLPNGKPNQGYPDCAKSSALLAEFTEAGLSPVWQNYCLKGTQGNFITSTGVPTVLGSSVIEGLNGRRAGGAILLHDLPRHRGVQRKGRRARRRA
jgi:hypothetical protein